MIQAIRARISPAKRPAIERCDARHGSDLEISTIASASIFALDLDGERRHIDFNAGGKLRGTPDDIRMSVSFGLVNRQRGLSGHRVAVGGTTIDRFEAPNDGKDVFELTSETPCRTMG